MDDLVTRSAESGKKQPAPGYSWKNRAVYQPLLQREERRPSILGTPVLDPRISRLFRVANVTAEWVDCTYSAFKVPIGVAIFQDCTAFGLLTLCDIVAGVVLTPIICLRLYTAVVAKRRARELLVPDGKLIAASYVQKGLFVIDVISLIPFFVQGVLLVCCALRARSAVAYLIPAMPVLNALRLVRMSHVFSIVKNMFVEALGGDLNGKLLGMLPTWAVYLVDLVYAKFVLINMMGCLWLWTAYFEGILRVNWLSDVGGNDLRGGSKVDQYVASIHFAMTTMATVGYGDVVPKTRTERIVAMIIMAIGLLFFGLLISAVGALLKDASTGVRRAKNLRRKMNEIDAYAEARELSEPLRQELTTYYHDVWVAYEEVHEGDLLKELPANLKTKVVMHVLKDVFESSHLFMGLDMVSKMELAAALTPQVVLPSHDLCREGDPADSLWILQTGTLEMVTKQQTKRLPAPAVVGEGAILRSEVPELASRSATFRATNKACTVWHLSMANLQALVAVRPQIKEYLMKGMAKSLRSALKPSQQQWREAFEKLRRRSSEEIPVPSAAAAGGAAGGSAARSVASSNDIFEHALMNRELPSRLIRVLSKRDRPEEVIAELQSEIEEPGPSSSSLHTSTMSP